MKVKGLITDEEGRALANIASQCVDLPIVEIGSYMGRSTCYLASQTSAPVYAIDLWDMRLPGEEGHRNNKPRDVSFESTKAFDSFLANIEKAGVQDKITWIKGDSREIAKAWTQHIGVLFIDGTHTWEGVSADYENWAKFIVPGGYIAFHDAHKGKPLRLINEIAKPSGLWEEWVQVDSLAIARRRAQDDMVWTAPE